MATIKINGQELEVQEDVELPARTRTGRFDTLADLPVGGGITYECDEWETKRTRSRLRSVEQRVGGEYTYRRVEGGVLIQRIG